MLKIAVAKGRIEEEFMNLLLSKSLFLDEEYKKSRKLILEEENIRVVLVKATDVPTYVDLGVCDMGIVGKDTVLEAGKSLFEICQFPFGKCRMSVASNNNSILQNPPAKLRVATKYPKIAESYFSAHNISVEIIPLMGSVELAPLVGLSDVIVDIVESGNTLKANGLVELESFLQLNACLIVNQSSFRFKSNEIQDFVSQIQSEEIA